MMKGDGEGWLNGWRGSTISNAEDDDNWKWDDGDFDDEAKDNDE